MFQQKTARIAPIKEYEEPAIRDGVYNHLNESDKADRSDYYDHAGPAPSMSVTKDGYGVVSMKSESKGESSGDYNTVDRKKMQEINRTIITLPLKFKRTNLIKHTFLKKPLTV